MCCGWALGYSCDDCDRGLLSGSGGEEDAVGKSV